MDKVVRELGVIVNEPELVPLVPLTVTIKALQRLEEFWQTVSVAVPCAWPYRLITEPVMLALTTPALLLLDK